MVKNSYVRCNECLKAIGVTEINKIHYKEPHEKLDFLYRCDSCIENIDKIKKTQTTNWGPVIVDIFIITLSIGTSIYFNNTTFLWLLLMLVGTGGYSNTKITMEVENETKTTSR